MQESIGKQLRVFSVCDDSMRHKWREVFTESEPGVICIHGPYINVSMLKRLCGYVDMSQASGWADVHGDYRNTGHHDHSEKKASNLEPLNAELLRELKDDHAFSIREGVRFRDEGNYLIAALEFNGFVINTTGKQLLSSCLQTNSIMTIGHFKAICRSLRISEQSGLDFLKRLYVFGLINFHDRT